MSKIIIARCDAITDVKTIEKLAHSYNNGQITLAATASSVGIMTYVCENCTHSYTEEIAKLSPQIIEQTKDTLKEWTGDETIAFRSNASFEDFVEVRINGSILPKDYYTLREGSIVVELKPEYLASLGNGNYRLDIVSKNGIATTDFSVNKKVVTNPWVYGSAIFVLVCALAFFAWLVFFKKKWIVLQFDFRKKGSNSQKTTVKANKTAKDSKSEADSKKSSEKANKAHEDSKDEPQQNKPSEDENAVDKEKASVGAEKSSQNDTTSNSQG